MRNVEPRDYWRSNVRFAIVSNGGRPFAAQGSERCKRDTWDCLRNASAPDVWIHVGDQMHQTTFGAMHPECAVQTAEDVAKWEAEHGQIWGVTVKPKTEDSQTEPTPQPIVIERDESQPSGWRIEGSLPETGGEIAQVLSNGTQRDLIAMYAQHVDQPIFGLSRATGRTRQGRDVLTYDMWKVVE